MKITKEQFYLQTSLWRFDVRGLLFDCLYILSCNDTNKFHFEHIWISPESWSCQTWILLMRIFAGMRTQHTSTLRQAQPRRAPRVLETSSCHLVIRPSYGFSDMSPANDIWWHSSHFVVQWSHLSWSYGTICHTAVCLFSLNSSQTSSPGMSYPKTGSLSKKRNVMFSSNFFVTLTRNDLRNLRIHSSNTRGLETWKNQPRLFVPFP